MFKCTLILGGVHFSHVVVSREAPANKPPCSAWLMISKEDAPRPRRARIRIAVSVCSGLVYTSSLVARTIETTIK